MSRIHYYDYVVDEDGKAVQGAQISIYLAGTDTPINVYSSEIGGTSVGTVPQVQTNNVGYFEFWIADDNEINGYHTSQKFKISWQKIGVLSGYVDYVSIFAPVVPVDETDPIDTAKDKSVSNAQMFLLTNHVYDTSHEVHGIEEVDEASSDVNKNKLVSNVLAKTWNDHAVVDFMTSTITTPTSGVAHGLAEVDVTSLDTKKNRVISNSLAKEWNDHKDFLFTGTLGTSADNAHGLEAANLADNDNIFNKTVSNALLNSIRASSIHTFNEIINTDDWTLNGTTGLYDYTINHGLNFMHVGLTVYDEITESMISPANVYSIDQDNTRLSLANNIQVKVLCVV